MEFDAAAALTGGVNSPGNAWRFITAFTEYWSTTLTSQDGFSLAEIGTAEDRLGAVLPSTLRDAFELFGRRADVTAWQDSLFSPSHLHFEHTDDGRILVFRSESQGCWAWGISEHDLCHEDPPVLLYSDGQAIPGWVPLFNHISLALVEATLSEQAMLHQYDGRGLARSQPLSPGLLTAIRTIHPRVGIPEYPWNYDPDGSAIRWHAGPGCLIQIIDGTAQPEAIVIAQTQEHLQRTLTALPGPWPPSPELKQRELFQLPPGIDDPWATPGGYFSG